MFVNQKQWEILIYFRYKYSYLASVAPFIRSFLHSHAFPIDFASSIFSLWLCTFSLAVAICAALLLPISIASNEVLLLYPLSYYVKWLNSSLVHGNFSYLIFVFICRFQHHAWQNGTNVTMIYSMDLIKFDHFFLFSSGLLSFPLSLSLSFSPSYLGLWNHVFLFSNLSLFVLLPFSYLFAESSGFFGHRKGIISRAYETFTVFSLLAVVVLGITYVVSAVIYPEKRGLQTLLSKRSILRSFWLCTKWKIQTDWKHKISKRFRSWLLPPTIFIFVRFILGGALAVG